MMSTGGPASARPRSGPVLYHLADVRLGGAIPFLAEAGAGQRTQVRETFVRAVDQGLEYSPSAVLITGNLFGTSFPSRELGEFARTQLARFTAAGIPVLITAGPLDALFDKHYASGAFSDLDRLSIFPAAPKVIVLPDVDTSVVGVSWSSTPPPADFLAGLSGQRSSRYVVAAFAVPWPESEEALRSLRRQIGASGASYVALGGSPVRRDVSTEKVAACYPGSPELVATEEGEGSPLLVRLDGRIEVTPKPVARRRFGRFTLQPIAYAGIEDLAAAIRGLGDPNLAAVVRLTGGARVSQFIDVAELRDRLSREFLSLEIVDDSQPSLEEVQAAAYPELSVAGKFVGVVRGELERATTDDARRRLGAALRLGLALLEGRRPT